MMKNRAYFYFVMLFLCISSCDYCWSDNYSIDGYDDQKFSYKIDASKTNNTSYYLIPDSVYLIHPKILRLNNEGEIPYSYESNSVTAVFYHQNALKDTVTFEYTASGDYSEKCKRYSFVIRFSHVSFSTFPSKYNIIVQ